MATEAEKNAAIRREEERIAAEWMAKHGHEIPPVLGGEIGTSVPLGETGRQTPVVRLNDERVGPVNNPHPTEAGREHLQPWPGQGSQVDKAAQLRPVEEDADGDKPKKK